MRSGLIYVTNFLLTAALGVVFIFLEDVQVDLGLSDLDIGLIAGTGFGAALFAHLLLSPLADRGITTPLSVVALVAGVLGPIGFALGTSVGVLAVSRGLTGIGLGLFGLLARKALLGLDATGGGAKLGILLSTAVAGFISGPLIGAAFEPLGFAAPFIAVSIGIAIAGVPATIAIARTEVAATVVDHSELGRLLRRPRIQAAMLCQAIVWMYIGVFDATLDRFLTDLGASTSMVAVVIICVGAPMLILPRVAGSLAEANGAANVMLPSLLILLPVMAGYGWAGAIVTATIAGVFHGIGESFVSVSAQVLVLEVTGAERAAVGSALLETAGLSSAALGAGIGPIVYGARGQDVFLWTAVIGLVLGLVALQRIVHARRSERWAIVPQSTR